MPDTKFKVERDVYDVEGCCWSDDCDWTADGEIAGDYPVAEQCEGHAAETGHEVHYTETYTFEGHPATPNPPSGGDAE